MPTPFACCLLPVASSLFLRIIRPPFLVSGVATCAAPERRSARSRGLDVICRRPGARLPGDLEKRFGRRAAAVAGSGGIAGRRAPAPNRHVRDMPEDVGSSASARCSALAIPAWRPCLRALSCGSGWHGEAKRGVTAGAHHGRVVSVLQEDMARGHPREIVTRSVWRLRESSRTL